MVYSTVQYVASIEKLKRLYQYYYYFFFILIVVVLFFLIFFMNNTTYNATLIGIETLYKKHNVFFLS